MHLNVWKQHRNIQPETSSRKFSLESRPRAKQCELLDGPTLKVSLHGRDQPISSDLMNIKWVRRIQIHKQNYPNLDYRLCLRRLAGGIPTTSHDFLFDTQNQPSQGSLELYRTPNTKLISPFISPESSLNWPAIDQGFPPWLFTMPQLASSLPR